MPVFLRSNTLPFSREDIPENGRLSEPITVQVRNILKSDNSKLDSVIIVEDGDGAPISLKVWSTHDLELDLNTGSRYQLNGVRGTSWLKNGTRQYELSSTRDFQAINRGPADDAALRLLVVGDTHVGYRHRNRSDKVKSARYLAARKSFRRVLEEARALAVDAIIHAGDLFDHVATGYDREFVRNLLLDEFQEIPFYYVYGNHDVPASRRTLDGATSSATHVTRLTRTAAQINSSGFNLFGIDYANSAFPGDPLEAPTAGASANILVVHDTPYPVRNSDGQLLHRKKGADFRDAIATSPVPVDFIVSGHMHVGQQGTLDDLETPVVVTGAPAPIFKGNRDTAPSTWLLRLSRDSPPDVIQHPL